jgi:hypothetical protein
MFIYFLELVLLSLGQSIKAKVAAASGVRLQMLVLSFMKSSKRLLA